MEIFTDGLSREEFYDVEICSMLKIWEDDTGLKYRVFLDYFGKERKRENNSPRLMIDLSGHEYEDIVPVSIDKFNPEVLIDREVPDFEGVAEWIKKNYVILISHWNQKLDDVDVGHLFCDENKVRDGVKKLFEKRGEGEEGLIRFKKRRREFKRVATLKLQQIINQEKEAGCNVNNSGR